LKRISGGARHPRRLVNVAACGLIVAGAVLSSAGTARAQPAHGGAANQYLLGMSMILSGDIRSIGMAIKDGAELATIQRSQSDLARLRIGVSLYALDDGVKGLYSPAKDSRNAAMFLANPHVFAEDGPYNSGAAKASMPVYNRGDMAQISPGNTLPDLTYPSNVRQLQPATAAGRHGRTYFRVCTTDAFQGPAGVQFAQTRFHPSTGYIVNDWGLPGIGLANAYQRSLPTLGIRVLGRAGLQQSQPSSSAAAIAAAIAKAHPDAVFFGGEPDTGGATFADALRSAGVTVPIIGGDGLFTSSWIVGADGHYHTGSHNSWMTVIGPNPLQDPNVRQFTIAFRARYHRDPTPFAVLAYDAANLEINALVKALSEGKGGTVSGLREAVRANVQSSSFSGLAGTSRFDRNGDTTDKVIGIWHVTGTTATSFGWLGYAPGYEPRRG
jgi:branched-chain amino acid transport system substrate-binding protein